MFDGVSNEEVGLALKLTILLSLVEETLSLGGKDEKLLEMLRKVYVNGFLHGRINLPLNLNVEPLSLDGKCYICEGLLQDKSLIEKLALKATEKLGEYEYNTFLVGTKLPRRVLEKEDEVRARFNLLYGESIKRELNRLIGTRIRELTGKQVDFENPDVRVIIDVESGEVNLEVKPIYIYGRYRKYVRGIPQTKWPCRVCGGKGCERCKWTGKMYQESVEECIGKVLVEEARADGTKFHGAGREDIDARMLGDGRPFIIELVNPRKRSLNLEYLEKRINEVNRGKIEVKGLRFSSKEEVRTLKQLSGKAKKTYRVIVEAEDGLTEEDLEKIKSVFRNVVVEQQTPKRVLHRRSDKLRRKKVYEIDGKIINGRKAELTITCDGGLYIKELVDGDEGRTTPSISEVLGKSVKCVSLDVIKVWMEDL